MAPYAEIFKEMSSDREDNSRDPRFLRNKVRKLSMMVKILKDDIQNALDELDELARALGACEECWGKDKNCPECKGYGITGFYEPDQDLVEKLVLPALRKIPWIEIKENKMTTGDPSTSR